MYDLESMWDDMTREVTQFVMFWIGHTTLFADKPLPHSFDQPGKVSDDLFDRLEALATSLGYRIEYDDLTELGALGVTKAEASWTEYTPHSITLDPKMSPASRLRTLLHELGHALNNEPGRHDVMYRMYRHMENMNEAASALEELTVQLAAGMVVRYLGYTDDQFTPAYAVAFAREGPKSIDAVKADAIALAQTLINAVA